jgi:hypothetical protein
MSEMVEKVAKAIAAALGSAVMPDDGGLDHLLVDGDVDALALARAAIAAMREPTAEMLAVEIPVCDLGSGPPDYQGSRNRLVTADPEMYAAMVDAALAP